MSSASSSLHLGSQNAVHESGLSETRSVLDTIVMYHETAPTPATAPASSVRMYPSAMNSLFGIADRS